MEVFTYADYKHPLEHTWTLWYLDSNKNKSWEECLMEVGSFSTIEDFWCFFNHIKPPSHLKSGCDYCLFKKGIRPMWEDEANRKGGRWLLNVDKRTEGERLNQYWLELAIAMIGESFCGFNGKINGATINIRSKGNKIGLWVKENDQENMQKEKDVIGIGMILKEIMGAAPNDIITYQPHESNYNAVNNNITTNNNKQTGQKFKYYV